MSSQTSPWSTRQGAFAESGSPEVYLEGLGGGFDFDPAKWGVIVAVAKRGLILIDLLINFDMILLASRVDVAFDGGNPSCEATAFEPDSELKLLNPQARAGNGVSIALLSRYAPGSAVGFRALAFAMALEDGAVALVAGDLAESEEVFDIGEFVFVLCGIGRGA